MKRMLFVAAAVAAFLVSTTASSAASKWGRMTLTQKQTYLQQLIHRNRTTVRWWLHHRSNVRTLDTAWSFALPPQLPRPCASLGVAAPVKVCWKAQQIRHATVVLDAVRNAIYLASLPAHYALWMCEHGDEARNWHDQDSGGNGHYGGMQMTRPWGQGDYYLADPADATPLEQMDAAERGFAANGYSEQWLLGQWDHPDCLQYA